VDDVVTVVDDDGAVVTVVDVDDVVTIGGRVSVVRMGVDARTVAPGGVGTGVGGGRTKM